MAKIETWFTCDLHGPVQVHTLDNDLFNQDSLGNVIGVRVYSKGEPVTLSGSVNGYIVRSDGVTVPVAGTRSGNRAYITMPSSAYAVVGVVQIVIKLTEGSSITTLAACVGYMHESRTASQVDPGSTVTDWTNQIAAAIQEMEDIILVQNNQPDSETNKIWLKPTSEEYQVPTWEEFSELKSAFEAEQEINESSITLAFDDYEIARRYITDVGGWSTPSSSSTIRSACVRIPDGCTKVKVTTTGEANHYVAFLSSDTGFTDGSGLSPQFSSSYIGRILLNDAQEKVFSCYSDVKYIWIMTANSTGVDITPAIVFYIDAKESIELLLKNENAVLANGTISNDSISSDGAWAASSRSFKSSCVRVPVGTKTVEVSYKNGTVIAFLKSLTNRRNGGACSFDDVHTTRVVFSSEGQSKFKIGSDCKWVYTNTITRDGTDVAPTILFKPDILRNGDMPDIEEYTNGKFFNIMPTLYEGWFNWKLHFSYLSGGGTNSADGFATTEPIPVVPGNQVVNISATEDESENAINFYIVEFNGDTFVRRYALASGSQYVVPSGVTAIRFMFGFASASNVSITKDMLSKYFAVKFLSVAAQNDFETPVYVAYGASTTIGAVHRFTGQGTFYSAYAYPDYICRALNLRGYNHGHGSTGFLARSDGSVPNIMDCIYADGDLLEKAGLITIMFGYGNDRGAGLPIGLYDDYYPYDSEGYHPSGSAGIATMLANGATLMGCLNWCIKWISEHYPKATLVIIFGSPSANEDRAVSVVANPDETAGRPPYKLNIAEPYVDNDPQPYSVPSTGAKGIAQIKTELDKLRAALNVPVVDLFFGGLNINAYNAKAKGDDGKYAIFSTTGTADDQTSWAWNSHPNDAGYKMYAQFIAGRVIALYKH